MWQSIAFTVVGLAFAVLYGVLFALFVLVVGCGYLVWYTATLLSNGYRASLSKIKRFLADLGAR